MNNIQEKRNSALKKQRLKTNKLLDDIKNNPCSDCGITYNTICMDFDHLDTKTRSCIDFNQLRGSPKKILHEITKCELVCSNCHRVRTYNRKIQNKMCSHERPYINRNRQLLRDIKNVPCKDCHISFHFAAMDFDHINNDKKQNVATMISLKQSRLIEEIAKCEIVCSNCHRIRTKTRAKY